MSYAAIHTAPLVPRRIRRGDPPPDAPEPHPDAEPVLYRDEPPETDADAMPAGVEVARTLLDTDAPAPEPGWRLEALAGRFVEVSGGPSTAALTRTIGLIAEAHGRGAFAAWVGGRTSIFFPPDAAAAGVDLDALPVVRVANAREAARAADVLTRSGSFALVVLDLGSLAGFDLAMQTRLVGLAKKHRTAIVVITRTAAHADAHPSSLVSLRAETRIERADHDAFACALQVVKDKRGAPGWTHSEKCCGPDGLC